MRNNKHNLKPGDSVRLDKGYANSSIVKIVSMTPHMMYSRVVPVEIKDPKEDDMWETMTNRLTPLEDGR